MMRRALAPSLVAALAACDGGGALAEDAGHDGLPDAAGRVVRVVAGASPGGDGSERAPYATLDEAVQATDGAATYRLSPGRHPLPATLGLADGAALVGSGSSLTTVEGTAIVQLGGSLGMDGVGLDGAVRLEAFAAPAGQAASFDAVDVALRQGASLRTAGVAVAVDGLVAPDGGTLAFGQTTRVALEDVRMAAATITIEDVDAVEVAGLEVLGSPSPALWLAESSGTLRDVRLEDIDADDAGASGDGLRIAGGEVVGERVDIVRAAGRAVHVTGAGASFEELRVEGAGMVAVLAADGASVRLERSTVREAGTLVLASDGAAVDIVDTDLGDARQLCAVAGGAGTRLSATGGFVSRCPDGAFSFLDGAVGGLDGVVVEETTNAGCVAVVDTSGVRIAQSTLRRCAASGVGSLRSSDVEVVSSEIAGVLTDPVVADATAALIAVDSTVLFTDNRVVEGAGAGIRLLRTGGTVRGNIISSTRGEGVSVVADGITPLSLVDNRISDALGVGVLVAEATVALRGNAVAGTRWDAAEGVGDGIVFGDGAAVDVRENQVSGSAGNGLAWFAPASGVVEGNRVSGNAGFGLLEYCTGGEPADVEIGVNELLDNTAGDVSVCP